MENSREMKQIKIQLIPALLVVFWGMHVHVIGQYSRIPEGRVDQERLAIAESISTSIMVGVRSGNIYLLGPDEATPAMMKGMNAEQQMTVYMQLKNEFGPYQSLSFYEAMIPDNQPEYTLYRFKGNFDKPGAAEIRAVLDQQGRLAGFWVLRWQDEIAN